ncbi:hypothetical protein BH11PAT4_BH11PAT4_5780 [soil metagenome]
MGIFVAIFSFIITSLTVVVAGELSFYVIPFLASAILFLLTFHKKQTPTLPILAGWAMSLELLGTQQPGAASGLAACLLGLHSFLSSGMNFTSPFNRFLLSSFLLTVCYNLLFFGAGGFLLRGIYLLVAFPLFCGIFTIWHVTRYTTPHERS